MIATALLCLLHGKHCRLRRQQKQKLHKQHIPMSVHKVLDGIGSRTK